MDRTEGVNQQVETALVAARRDINAVNESLLRVRCVVQRLPRYHVKWHELDLQDGRFCYVELVGAQKDRFFSIPRTEYDLCTKYGVYWPLKLPSGRYVEAVSDGVVVVEDPFDDHIAFLETQADKFFSRELAYKEFCAMAKAVKYQPRSSPGIDAMLPMGFKPEDDIPDEHAENEIPDQEHASTEVSPLPSSSDETPQVSPPSHRRRWAFLGIAVLVATVVIGGGVIGAYGCVAKARAVPECLHFLRFLAPSSR